VESCKEIVEKYKDVDNQTYVTEELSNIFGLDYNPFNGTY